MANRRETQVVGTSALLNPPSSEDVQVSDSPYARGIQTLQTLATGPLTAAEVARALGVHRSTALRILMDLEAAGYVTRDQTTKRFLNVTSRLFLLFSRSNDFSETQKLIDGLMGSLQEEFGEAACFGVPAQGFMVYTSYFPSSHAIALTGHVGLARPMHCSAIGKAYLAALPISQLDVELGRLTYVGGTEQAVHGPMELRERLAEVREVGYAIDWGEAAEGGACVAVAVWLHGELIGSAGFQGPISRLPRERLELIGKRLVEVFGALT